MAKNPVIAQFVEEHPDWTEGLTQNQVARGMRAMWDAKGGEDVPESRFNALIGHVPLTVAPPAEPKQPAVAPEIETSEDMWGGAAPSAAIPATPDATVTPEQPTLEQPLPGPGMSATPEPVPDYNMARGAAGRAAQLTGDLFGFGEQLSQSAERTMAMGGFVWEPGNALPSYYSPEKFRQWQEQGGRQPLDIASEHWRGEEYGYIPKHTWDAVKKKFSKGGAFSGSAYAEVLQYAAEQGVKSIPDMMAVTLAPFAYVPARSAEIGEERAKNKGKESADLTDMMEAAPAAVASAVLERIGAKGITQAGAEIVGKDVLKAGAKAAAKHIAKAGGKAATKEALTEFAQEGIIEYLGEKYGTDAALDIAEALDRGLAGAVAGGVYGGAAGTAVAGGQAAIQSADPQRAIGREMLDQESGMVARPIDPFLDPGLAPEIRRIPVDPALQQRELIDPGQLPMQDHLATALRARGLDPAIVIPLWGLGGQANAGQAPGTAIPEQEPVDLDAPAADQKQSFKEFKKGHGFDFGALKGKPKTKDVELRETGPSSWRLTHPKVPGIEGTIGVEDEGMSIYMEVVPDEKGDYPAKGTGVATAIYLRGLEKAQELGIGWVSDSIMSDETYAMYERLKKQGIPFDFDGGRYVLSAEDIKGISFDDVPRETPEKQTALEVVRKEREREGEILSKEQAAERERITELVERVNAAADRQQKLGFYDEIREVIDDTEGGAVDTMIVRRVLKERGYYLPAIHSLDLGKDTEKVALDEFEKIFKKAKPETPPAKPAVSRETPAPAPETGTVGTTGTRPPSPAEPETKAAAESLPVQIRESDIHPQGAFNGMSHTPENHERAWTRGYIDEMTDLWKSAEGKITDENRDRVTEAFLQLKSGYSSRLNAFFAANGRVMSAFVTGPANFPTRSNEKKSDTADKRMAEANAWLGKGKKRLQRAILGPIDHSPQAVLAQTQSKLKEREETQQKMKAVNAAHRNFLKDPASLNKSNLTEAEKKIVREYNPEFSFNPHPFAPYELTNNNAEIRRLKKRIEGLSVKTVKADEGEKEYSFDGGAVVLDYAEDRLRVLFDEKPDAEMRNKLKANGFRWSPRNLSWQRQITEDAKYKAKDILGVEFKEQGEGGSDKPAKPETETPQEKPSAKETAPEKESPTETAGEEVLASAITETAYKLGGNRYLMRVYIADILAAMPGTTKQELHEALLKMSDTEKIALYPLEDPQERTERYTDGAVMVAGEANEIAYFEAPTLQEPSKAETKSPDITDVEYKKDAYGTRPWRAVLDNQILISRKGALAFKTKREAIEAAKDAIASMQPEAIEEAKQKRKELSSQARIKTLKKHIIAFESGNIGEPLAIADDTGKTVWLDTVAEQKKELVRLQKIAKPKAAKPREDPYKRIAHIRMPVDVTIRETGERKLDTESAGVLLREADDRISALRALKGCLSS